MEDEEHTNALIGAILAVVHPNLYGMQFDVLSRLNADAMTVNHSKTMQGVLPHWSTPFTGFALISNRESPFHRDTKGGKELYDLVASFGNYRGGRFEVPLFGSKFAYNPGSVFILPGFIFEHGASRVEGDRVCFANFFKPTVGYGAKADYEEVGLPTTQDLSNRYGLEFSE